MIEAVQKAPVAYVSNQKGGEKNHVTHMEQNMLNSSDFAKYDIDKSGILASDIKQDGNEKIDKEKLVQELNDISKSFEVDIKFSYNDKIDEVYISVIDKKSGDIIRKLPSEDAMKIKETMKDFIGSLFDTKG